MVFSCFTLIPHKPLLLSPETAAVPSLQSHPLSWWNRAVFMGLIHPSHLFWMFLWKFTKAWKTLTENKYQKVGCFFKLSSFWVNGPTKPSARYMCVQEDSSWETQKPGCVWQSGRRVGLRLENLSAKKDWMFKTDKHPVRPRMGWESLWGQMNVKITLFFLKPESRCSELHRTVLAQLVSQPPLCLHLWGRRNSLPSMEETALVLG